jgi:hypothetical protein
VQSHGSMNKNRISGRADGVSGHQTTKPFGSIRTVNAAIVGRQFTFLSGEISGTCARFGSAPCGNARGDAGEVSIRHISPTPEVMLRIW